MTDNEGREIAGYDTQTGEPIYRDEKQPEPSFVGNESEVNFTMKAPEPEPQPQPQPQPMPSDNVYRYQNAAAVKPVKKKEKKSEQKENEKKLKKRKKRRKLSRRKIF